MSFSQDFLEKVVLLALTASVTGFLVPYLLKKVEDRRAQRHRAEEVRKAQAQQEVNDRRLREQKQYEASLVRQGKIIDAQVRLLENLATLIWEYQLLAIEVSYFNPIEQPELYCAAVEEYDRKTSPTFAKIRAEISKALHLTSVDVYEELKRLYYKDLLPLDMDLYALMRSQRSSKAKLGNWSKFNRYAVYDLADKIDSTLNNLAKELLLKSAPTD